MDLRENTPSRRSEAMVEALAHVLGKECRLTQLSQCCAWNAMGPGAHSTAELLKAQAEELFAAQNRIAERIVHLGGRALPAEGEQAVIAPPLTAVDRTSSVTALIGLVVEAHGDAILALDSASDVARDNEDHGTLALLGERSLAHSQQRHALQRCI